MTKQTQNLIEEKRDEIRLNIQKYKMGDHFEFDLDTIFHDLESLIRKDERGKQHCKTLKDAILFDRNKVIDECIDAAMQVSVGNDVLGLSCNRELQRDQTVVDLLALKDKQD